MARCVSRKRDSTPCERIVGASKQYCYAHDPARAEARKRNASKGGRSKPNKELADVKRLISGLIGGVLKGTTNRGDAAVCAQLANTQLRAVAVELRVREQLDLVERVEELESLLERQSEGRGYVS